MRYHVTVGDRSLQVDLGPEGTEVEGRPIEAHLARLPDTRIHSLVIDGRSYRFVCRRNGRGVWELHHRGRRIRADVVDERTRAIQELTGGSAGVAGPEPVRAPMPGLVVRIEVEEGQTVAPGDGLAVVEAMKMENELRADAPGTVRSIEVAEGQSVDRGEVLIEFEPPESDG